MYEAYITKIKNIRKHSNADKLQCCTIFGNNVIVDKSYYEGQKVIYFPVDGQLSEEYAKDNNLLRKKDLEGNNIGGYLDPLKRNIIAIKLRGERSDGLVLPIETLSKYTDITKLNEGDKITVLNGHEICKKYIPKVKNISGVNLKNNKSKKKFPFFYEHIDTKQLAYNKEAFKPGDIIYLTDKLHGTSFRVANTMQIKEKNPNMFLKLFGAKKKIIKNFRLISGTRRTILEDFDGGFYGTNEFRRKYQNIFLNKLPKGFTVYGEIVGWINDKTPIMPICDNSKILDKEFRKKYGKETIFSYGCSQGENDCYIYRITVTNDDGIVIELPTEETIRWCEKLGVKFVPLLEKFMYTTWEDLNERCKKYLDIPEKISQGKHVTEGVVVRIDNRSQFTAYKIKSFAFKVLEGIIKDTSNCPDIEEAEELILNDT